MNLIIDQLPTAVDINGKEYAINSDFRTCLRIVAFFESNEFAYLEKDRFMLNSLYPVIPEDVSIARKQAFKFLNGGEEKSSDEEIVKTFSLVKDHKFIFSAFRQTHGIDLETAEMHWWKFLALFMDLGSETTFCNLVALRKRIANGTATREERKAASDLGDLIEIEQVDNRSIEEREKEVEFMQLLNGGK